MPETTPITESALIDAFIHAEPLPAYLTDAEAEIEYAERRKAAQAFFTDLRQKTRSEAIDDTRVMFEAYRPEVVCEVAVRLSEEADWAAIAEWCGAEVKSSSDGTDSGEWMSWLELPDGTTFSENTWVVKGYDGGFKTRWEVLEPDADTLRQVEAVGWGNGVQAVLDGGVVTPDGRISFGGPHPYARLLPRDSSIEEHGIEYTPGRQEVLEAIQAKRRGGWDPASAPGRMGDLEGQRAIESIEENAQSAQRLSIMGGGGFLRMQEVLTTTYASALGVDVAHLSEDDLTVCRRAASEVLQAMRL